jgi:hypothetical protein
MNRRTRYIEKVCFKIGLDPYVPVIRQYLRKLRGILAINDNVI